MNTEQRNEETRALIAHIRAHRHRIRLAEDVDALQTLASELHLEQSAATTQAWAVQTRLDRELLERRAETSE